MVKMGVGEKDGIYSLGGNRKRSPVSSSEMPFLIKATIHQQPGTIRLQKVSGTSYILGGTQETYLD
jgi:hypothetical protein